MKKIKQYLIFNVWISLWSWIKSIYLGISCIWNKKVRKELKDFIENEKLREKQGDLLLYIDYCVDNIYFNTSKLLLQYTVGKDEKEQKEEIKKMITESDLDPGEKIYTGYMKTNVYGLYIKGILKEEAAEILNKECQYWFNNSASVM